VIARLAGLVLIVLLPIQAAQAILIATTMEHVTRLPKCVHAIKDGWAMLVSFHFDFALEFLFAQEMVGAMPI